MNFALILVLNIYDNVLLAAKFQEQNQEKVKNTKVKWAWKNQALRQSEIQAKWNSLSHGRWWWQDEDEDKDESVPGSEAEIWLLDSWICQVAAIGRVYFLLQRRGCHESFCLSISCRRRLSLAVSTWTEISFSLGIHLRFKQCLTCSRVSKVEFISRFECNGSHSVVIAKVLPESEN